VEANHQQGSLSQTSEELEVSKMKKIWAKKRTSV